MSTIPDIEERLTIAIDEPGTVWLSQAGTLLSAARAEIRRLRKEAGIPTTTPAAKLPDCAGQLTLEEVLGS